MHRFYLNSMKQIKRPDLTSWEQQAYTRGLRAGWEEGWRAGQREGLLQVVLRQLTLRFGKLDRETKEEIKELAPGPLADLAEALQYFAEPDDLRLWLNWRIISVVLFTGSLRRQLGKLDPTMEAEIEQLSVAQRKKLDSASKSFTVPQDLEKWLRRHARPRATRKNGQAH